MRSPQVSVYNGVSDRIGVSVSLDAVISRVRNGGERLSEKCEMLRVLLQTDPEAYTREKRKLPAVTWSGSFKGRKELLRHSGFIVLDYDGIDIGSLLSSLSAHQNVYFAFVSPSGAGVKAIVPVSPIPTSREEHKHAFKAVYEEFEEFGEIDPSGSDVGRLCFLAHDPQAIHHPNAKPLEWEAPDVSEETHKPASDTQFSGEADLEALDVIDPLRLDYQTWRNVGMAIKDAGFGVEVFQKWSGGQRTRSTGKIVTEDILAHWNRYNSQGITWATVVHLARENGWMPKRSHRKPVKLFKSEYAGVLSTLDKARSFLSDVFEKGSQFFAIRTDTGTGKTEQAVTYALTKDVAIPTLSGTLRDEIVGRARNKEIYAWGYRGIRDTDDSDGYMPCIQSERFEVLRNKGYNPYKWICESCPVNSECKQRGYLSQPERARHSQLVSLPFPTAFLDPRLRSWAKLYLPRGKDALILHDDLPLGSLFYDCRLSAERLRRITEDWKDTKAAWWAAAVLEVFIKRDWERLRNITIHLDNEYKYSIHAAMTSCVDPETGAVVSTDEYLASPAVTFSTADDCASLPQVDGDFDVATLLEMFFRRYPRVEDAPFYYDIPTESFVFYLPPEPIKSKRKTIRVGFASATLQEHLIKRIFPGIDFYDTALTEWVEGAQVFQLRTNRNPRATVLSSVEKFTPTGEKVWEWADLNATGESYYQSVIDFIKAHPNDRHAVFSYKCVIEEKHSELDGLGVVTAHFGDVAGLDTAFVGVKYFHILFCPFVDPASVENLAKLLFGNDETPLKRDTDGNLERSDDGSYTDERVQVCQDTLVEGELRQAVGRARLNLYPNCVFLWTSLVLDGISNRKEITLFDELDWEEASSFDEGVFTDRLSAVIAKREAREVAAEDAVAAGDVAGVMETKGVKMRQAYDDTRKARKLAKAERDAEIFRRYDAGESYRRIATVLSVAPNTVKNVLKNRAF